MGDIQEDGQARFFCIRICVSNEERAMADKSLLYWMTFAGLYLELIGAFLLAVEAIGKDHLRRAGNFMKKRRVFTFILFIISVCLILLLSRAFAVFRLTEAFVLIFSLGVFIDFAPRLFEIIIRRLERGTAGIIGFVLFALGFSVQAYISLVQLR